MSKASQKAFTAIRGKILSGEFPPGSHLKEEELAEVCGVSRTPIRDALRALAGEDYVKIVPNHGTYVSQWSSSDIEDIFALRAMLEGYASRRAAERGAADLGEKLEACCDRIDAMLERAGKPDTELFLRENRLFHDLLTEAAESDKLRQLISRLVEQPVVARTALLFGPADMQRSNAQHREIVAAIRAGNGEWAESVMKSHILAAFTTYRQIYGPAKE